MKQLKVLSAAILLTAATAAQADITTYNSVAAFNAATTARGVDTYDDLAIELLPEQLSRTAGMYSYMVEAPGSSLYGAGSAADGWLSTNRAADIMHFFTFGAGVSAVGGNFFGSDIAGQWLEGTSIVVHVTDASGTTDVTLSDTDTTTFVGFTSSSGILSLSVERASDDIYWTTANNLTLGQMAYAVPEPAEYAMLLAGLGALGWIGRRRRG